MNPALTHIAAVLFREAPTLEALHATLGGMPNTTDARLESKYVRLDTPAGVIHAAAYSAPWPDEDPESLAELGGTAAGLYPGALARAGDQSVIWPRAEWAASVHSGFVHFAVAEATGSPHAQIEELERLAIAMLANPAALCVFFPAGESLRDGHVIGQIRAASTEQDAVPFQIWINGRIADSGKGAVIADLIGSHQVGLPDAEAVFPERDDLPPYEVLGFLLDVSHHLVLEGGALEDGVVYEGPGGLHWRASLDVDAQIPPARKLVRWIPLSPDQPLSSDQPPRPDQKDTPGDT